MNQSLQLELLAALGYATFERNEDGSFRTRGEAPEWLSSLLQSERQRRCPLDCFPFLEVFLLDAEEFWADPKTRSVLRSDYWTQTDMEGTELHLCATALLLKKGRSSVRNLLVVESAGHRFQETQRLVLHSHETSLAYDKIAKLSRELERATEAKSEFLARMSHEVRTPMNALLGMAELLMETSLNPEQREYVRIFRRAGDNLLNVVNDILDFSKVEAGHIELESIAFDLADVLERAIEVAAVGAHLKGLELSGRIRPGVQTLLLGDPGRLRQILLNLLGNATKFTDLGELTVLVDMNPDDRAPGVLHVAVSDTGVGIPADRISSIFDSFTQVDASTTRKFGGTGLGLAISKRFVELMGGKIWVESTPGSGTTIHFTARFGVQEVVKTPPSELIGLRCLVADDNTNHRGAAVDILAGWGAQVSESDGPTSALDKILAADPPYHLVLVDGRMQTADDGLALATRIKEERLARRVILMLTTDCFKDVARCRELGLGYVLKPVRRSELLEAIGGRPGRETDSDTRPAGDEGNAGTPAGERTLRILLADDSEDNRFLVRGYLKDSGYNIDEAENGSVAVKKFKQAAYDLVLTDVEMPVLDGFSATREMRSYEKERGSPPTPILALTAHALKEAKDRSIEAGCTDHLTKPIRKATLLEAIRRYTREPPGNGPIGVTVEPWLKPVVAGYLKKRRSDVVKLRSANDQLDYATVRLLGHQMAGTGASYGFAPITEIGIRLEEFALSRDAAGVQAKIEELESYLQLVEVD